MNEKYVVYKHTLREDGRVYIGQALNPEQRWGKDGSGYKSCPLFWDNIQHYGWDAFDHEIIFDNLSKDEADVIERVLIRHYDSTNVKKGFNLSVGNGIHGASNKCYRTKGTCNDRFDRRVTQYSIEGEKIREFASAEEAANETKVFVHSILNCCTHNHAFTAGGFRWAFEGELPRSLDGMRHSVKVQQYTPTGKLVANYNSMLEAANNTGISAGSISMACRGKQQGAGGFVWRYAV